MVKEIGVGVLGLIPGQYRQRLITQASMLVDDETVLKALVIKLWYKQKNQIYYTRGIMSKRVTSGGIQLRDSGHYNYKETSQRWLGVEGNAASVMKI